MHLGSRTSKEDNRINVNRISSWYISCSDIYFIELSIEIFHRRNLTSFFLFFVVIVIYNQPYIHRVSRDSRTIDTEMILQLKMSRKERIQFVRPWPRFREDRV